MQNNEIQGYKHIHYAADGVIAVTVDDEEEHPFGDEAERVETIPLYCAGPDGLLEAAKGLKRIVEEIDGTMNHGTWRDDKGVRLKDTPEWVALYLAISEAGHAD